MTPNTEILVTIFVIATAVSVLIQACILVAIFISVRKTSKALLDTTNDLKATILPLVHSSRDLVERISPQVITISAGMADLTEVMKRETAGVKFSATEIMERISLQIKRLDTMLTHGLNTVEKASTIMEHTVSAPVRQVNGVMAAIKAVVNTYRSGSSTSQR
jgi:hypothetical protein